MIPNLFDADVNTSPKPPFFPATGMILVLIFMIMVPIVALNLLQGLAVEDVQVTVLSIIVVHVSLSCISYENNVTIIFVYTFRDLEVL